MVNRNEVEIKVSVNDKDAKRGFKKVRVEADKTKDSVNKLSGSFKKLAGLVGGIALGAALTKGFQVSISSASNLQESINAVAVVFGDAATQITGFGQTAAREVGLANAEFNQLATTTGAMLKNVGFSQERMAAETIRLTKRAADMASVFNTDVTQALSAINAALRGEIDPIERFGVSMNIATIEAKALELGLAATKAEISAADKQVARLSVIMEQTAVVEGDFANTSDEFANSIRILKSDFIDLAASLGTKMIPAVEDALKVIGPMVAQIKDWSEEGANLEDIILDIAAANKELEPTIGFFDRLGREVKGAFEENIQLAKDFKSSLDQIDQFQKTQIDPLTEAFLGPDIIAFYDDVAESIKGVVDQLSDVEDFSKRVDLRQLEKAGLAMMSLGSTELNAQLARMVEELNKAKAPLEGLEREMQPLMDIFGEAIPTIKSFNNEVFDMSNPLDRAAAAIAQFEADIRVDAAKKIADLEKELFLRNNTADILELEAHWLQEQGLLQQQLVDAASDELRVRMETFQLQQRMHAFAVAGSTRSAGFIAASAGLGPGGGGVSGTAAAINAQRISGDLVAELAALINSGEIEGAKLTDEGQSGVGLELGQRQTTNVNVFLDEAQINSRLGQSVEDGA